LGGEEEALEGRRKREEDGRLLREIKELCAEILLEYGE
jgi:hypothetical protein